MLCHCIWLIQQEKDISTELSFDDKHEAHGCIKRMIWKLNEQYHIVTMFNDDNLTVGFGACRKPTQKITSISVPQKNQILNVCYFKLCYVDINLFKGFLFQSKNFQNYHHKS